MADIEKVKKGVKACWSEYFCHRCCDCPYRPDRDDSKCVERLGADVLELLKDQKINGERKGGRPKKEAEEEKTGTAARCRVERPQLKIRSLDSEVVRAGVYIRQENNTILLDIKDPLAENRIRLTAEEWLNFCDEIHTMVHQFDMKEE